MSCAILKCTYFIFIQATRIGLVKFYYSCQLKCYLARFVAILLFVKHNFVSLQRGCVNSVENLAQSVENLSKRIISIVTSRNLIAYNLCQYFIGHIFIDCLLPFCGRVSYLHYVRNFVSKNILLSIRYALI